MAKKKGEKMPMKIDEKTGKKVPAFLMKKGSMAKKELVGNQKNLNEGLKRAIKASPAQMKKMKDSAMKMKKAMAKLKKEEKTAMMMKKKGSAMMMKAKKSMATMKKKSAMMMKKMAAATKMMKKK